MKEKEEKSTTKYPKRVLAEVGELARMQISVGTVVEKLAGEGFDAEDCFSDITNPRSCLHIAYKNGLMNGFADVEKAMYLSALSGDSFALKLMYEKHKDNELDILQGDLFGV